MIINLFQVAPVLQISSSIFIDDEIVTGICTLCNHSFYIDTKEIFVKCKLCGTREKLSRMFEYKSQLYSQNLNNFQFSF